MRTVMRVVDDVRKPDRGHERVLMARGVGERPQMHAVAARQMMGRLRRTFMAVRDVRNRIEPEAEQHREQSSSQPLRRCTDPVGHVRKNEAVGGQGIVRVAAAIVHFRGSAWQTSWTRGMCEGAQVSPAGALDAPEPAPQGGAFRLWSQTSRGKGVRP